MPSTYTVNLGIEKPATGEQSGTWGDTTNVNFDILDQAINGAVVLTLANPGTSGTPNLLEISNGSTSDGRNKWIELTDAGDLGGTSYLRLDPNDAEKIVFVRNNLSGGQSAILFQGTYSTSNDFEVPAGCDVVLKFDGNGTSATVVDVYNKLRVTALTTPLLTTADLTATTADINGGTIDSSVIGGATAAAVTGTTVVANTSLNIAADGATVTGIKDEDDMASNSATKLATQQSIKAYVDAQVGSFDTLSEVLAQGNTSGTTNLVIDSGQVLTTNTVNETTVGAGVTIDSVLLKDDVVNATDIETSTISANDGTLAINIANTTGAVDIDTSLNVDGTVTIDGLTVDGNADVNGTVTADGLTVASGAYGTLLTAGGTNGYISVSNPSENLVTAFTGTNDALALGTSNTERMRIDSAGNVGIGTSSPTAVLDVRRGDEDGKIAELHTSTGYGIEVGSSQAEAYIQSGSLQALLLGTNNTERMRINSAGQLLLGKTAFDSSIEGFMADSRLFQTTDGGTTAFFNRLTNDGDIIEFRKDGTTVGSWMSRSSLVSTIILDPRTNGVGLGATTYTILPADNNGTINDNVLNIGNSFNRFKDLYLSGGVYLGGTGAANKLDDYETGTWNPHIKDTYDGSVLVVATSQGRYVKIGSILYLNINIYANGISATATGVPYIDLPFSITSQNDEGTAFIPGYTNGLGIVKAGMLVTSGSTLHLATTVENPYSNSATGATFSGSVRLYGSIACKVVA